MDDPPYSRPVPGHLETYDHAPEVIEIWDCYYGYSEKRNGKIYLIVLVEPGTCSGPKLPEKQLIIDVPPETLKLITTTGPMVVTAIRYQKRPKGEKLPKAEATEYTIGRGEFSVILYHAQESQGLPEYVTRITFDPNPDPPGEWRGELHGKWPVELCRINRRTAWEFLLDSLII